MRLPKVLLAMLLLAAASPSAQAHHAGVHISELLPSPDTGQREFIELWNDGPDVDLRNWTVRDATTTNVYTFGAVGIPSGGRIVLWGGGEGDARGPAWSRAAVWNAGGDQAIVRDAAGNTVDVLAYGSASWPDNRTAAVPATPAVGQSLTLRDGDWIHASPTPGTVSSEGGGEVDATVLDVAPQVAFTQVPAHVDPGATFTVSFSIRDDNGAEDVSAWRLLGDGVLLRNGTAAGDHTVSLGAPVDRSSWTLRLEATDGAGQQGNASATITVRAAGLVVVVPDLGIRFPAFPPGATEVVSEQAFVLRNDGSTTITPRIDVSDLDGPASIPLVGRLQLGSGTAWTAYSGALTPLPPLAPGEFVEVHLRLTDLPTPLPAGSYGTSFTVVA